MNRESWVLGGGGEWLIGMLRLHSVFWLMCSSSISRGGEIDESFLSVIIRHFLCFTNGQYLSKRQLIYVMHLILLMSILLQFGIS